MSCKISIVGIHLLLLAHIANSFVLLTANVEDVKRLARKFVSDKLVEKIADFIARATQNLASKVEEEHRENKRPKNIHQTEEESSQISEENNAYNGEVKKTFENNRKPKPKISIERENYYNKAEIKHLKKLKQKPRIETEQETYEISNEEKRTGRIGRKVYELDLKEGLNTTHNTDTIEPKHEEVDPPKPVKVKSRYIKDDSTESTLPDDKAVSKLVEEDEKANSKLVEEDDKAVSKLGEENERYERANESHDDLIASPKNRSSGHRLVSKDSFEDNKIRGSILENNTATTKNDINDETINVTTQKKKGNELAFTTAKSVLEFDQYDNLKLPKSEFKVSNSGVSKLLSVKYRKSGKSGSENWWEKEMPTPNQDEIPVDSEILRKSWF